MKFYFLVFSLVLCLEYAPAFFLFPEKQAIFLCLKVCPLYCGKRPKRDAGRYWDDDSAGVYDWPPTYLDAEEDHPYHFYHHHHGGHWVYCKPTTTTPKPTTTTMATTTAEPTWICEVCQKKCGTPLP